MEGQGKEYKFSVFIYPLTEAEAEALRARLEAVLLAEVEAAGKYMGPVDMEVNGEADHGGESKAVD